MLPYTSPPQLGSEFETLIGFLNAQRAILLWKLDGLDTETASRPAVESGTSLLGIVKHMAWVEWWWFTDFIGGANPEYPWSEQDPDADWRIEPDETIESIRALYVEAVAEANTVIENAGSLDVTGTVRGTERSLRWVMVHMIEEVARHVGHADILRELADGETGYVPEE